MLTPGHYVEQVSTDSPMANYDGKVSADGRMALSGIDGELVSLTLAGAQTILEPTASTPQAGCGTMDTTSQRTLMVKFLQT